MEHTGTPPTLTDATGRADVPGPATSLARIVTERPAAARVLERYGLDYCCGGATSLASACAEAGLDVDEVRGALADLGAAEPAEWASLSAAALAAHVVDTHHVYLQRELPRLVALAGKVTAVHGDHHPELAAVASAVEALRADLVPHMFKEERVLFPAIAEMEAATDLPWFPFGTTSNPISVMLSEHERTGELLDRLRDLTDDYRVPDDACASYRALYEGLAEVEADTHLHVHKENNVLFPAVVRMERELRRSAQSIAAAG